MYYSLANYQSSGERRSPLGLQLTLCVLAPAASALPLVPLPANTFATDALHLVLLAMGVVSFVHSPLIPKRIVHGVAIFVWMVSVGGMLGLFGIGITSWSIVALSKDLIGPVYLVALYQLLAAHRPSRRILLVAVTSALLAAGAPVLLSVPSTGRAAGLFSNPNYAAHIVAMAALSLSGFLTRLPDRIAAWTFTTAVLLATQSYGALAMVLAGAGWFLGQRALYSMRGTRWRLGILSAIALGSVAAIGFSLGMDNLQSSQNGPKLPTSDGAFWQRVDRSSGSRFATWEQALEALSDYPIGVGPGGAAERSIITASSEVHNDFLAYLLEKSFLGLAGLLVLLTSLWRSSPVAGITPVLLVATVTGSMVRETLNFRHVWIFLAFSLIYDHDRWRESAAGGRLRVDQGPTLATARRR